MTDRESELGLVGDAVAGDPIALQVLLDRNRDRLLDFIRRLFPATLRGHLGPEDVLQDACLEAFRRIRSFAPEGDDAFGRWLRTIARKQMVNLLEAHNAAKRGGGRANAGAEGDDSGVVTLLGALALYRRTPSASVAARELAAALERSIDGLPPDLWEAITLRHVAGVAAKDAAQRMARTEGAFHQLCHRGLRQLRVALRTRSIYV